MSFSIKNFLFVTLLIFPVAIFAQGSGSSEPKKNPKENNFAVTRSVNGIVKSSSKSSLEIKDKNGKSISFNITKNTRIRRSCLRREKNVRVIYTPEDRRATSISCQ